MNAILLAGAALVGLPILLHLIMKQEPKRLPFPAFRFLKQRLKTNQRKLRLRHWLLLALRMLLIALFCLTLYQPSILSKGLIDLSGRQPLAVVLVIDTSPSMGYAEGAKSNLEDAVARATELINDLPDGSRIAIVETGDPGGDWLPSSSDARSKLAEIAKKSPKPGVPPASVGGSQSVSASLVHAYQLLKTVDEQSDTQETLPRLVAIFTDRSASSWDVSRSDDLKKLRDLVPKPEVAHAVVDVGADKPVNVGLLAAEMHDGKPQQIPQGLPVAVTVTVGAVGLDANAAVEAWLDEQRPLRKEVEVKDGRTQTLTFDFRDLKPGLHQIRFKLANSDALMADNERFYTFRVVEPRKTLAITDDPGDPANGYYGDAHYWALAARANQFGCEVVKSDAVPADLGPYEAITLLSTARPDPDLWAKLQKYVEAGGRLIVAPPGDDRLVLDAWNGEAASKLLPGSFKEKPFDTASLPEKSPRRSGVAWSVLTQNDSQADRELQHPMLAPLKAMKARPDVDVFKSPRKAWKYWLVDPKAGGKPIVWYDNDDDPKNRHPAVLERDVGKGRVILLTTKLDPPGDADWNDYWGRGASHSWVVVFPDLLLRYAAGSAADVNYNHPVGGVVIVPLAKLLGAKRDNIAFSGPGVAGQDAFIRIAERQTEVRIGPPRTDSAGNFKLKAATAGDDAWVEGFSLNVPANESTLDKAPVEGIEDLTGAGTVVPAGKNVPLAEILAMSPISSHPVELFPWLLMLVLVLLVAENFLANRFYRRPS
jgi:hypothetical protein